MSRQRWIGFLRGAAMLVLLAGGSALADETVSVGGSRVILIKPSAPRGSVILMAGGDGNIRAGDHGDIHGMNGNQLVRTRHAYAARGLAVLVADAGTDLNSAVQYMAAIKRPVTVVATSLGTIRAARGIANGARPDALVLTSGFLSQESGVGATTSCRSSVRRHHCRARLSSITRRTPAETHCRPESRRFSNGREVGRA